MDRYNDHLQIEPTGLSLEAGRLLVSTPYFNDPFFNHSVVLLTDYEEEHTAGLIINRQLPHNVYDLVNEIKVEEPIFFGGPVMTEAVFLLHSFESCPEASRLLPGVYVGYNPVLIAVIEQHAIANLKHKFLLGYAGWSPGQLEDEIRRNMWVVAPATQSLVFDTPAEEVWTRTVQRLGKPYEHWLKIPKNIMYN
ncbi:MAG: YqgE/AlgH family protein [Bacteroidales bacterium]|jgi:putative transcriptional regulator|nr:YqgE/AlgH family protein [Bacteroidales bacterium]